MTKKKSSSGGAAKQAKSKPKSASKNMPLSSGPHNKKNNAGYKSPPKLIEVLSPDFDATQLVVEPLYRDLVSYIPSFLTSIECRKLIRLAERVGFELASHAASAEYAHRNNGRISIHAPRFAEAIWRRISPHVPHDLDKKRAVGCNENIRLYRYTQGQRFGQHVDESVPNERGEISKQTVLVYLNGGSSGHGGAPTSPSLTPEEEAEWGGHLIGGETVFYKNHGPRVAVAFAPLQGAALYHGHGARCLTHEGAVVSQGVKYLLRTDVMYA